LTRENEREREEGEIQGDREWKSKGKLSDPESRVAKSDNGEVMAVAATIRRLRYIANDDANDPLSRRRSLSRLPLCARITYANFVAGNGYDGKKIAGAIE